ncbi:MAG: hypothetical protein J5811_02560 [Lachnospiraceae bacterium]|nr:hypothetical protein [Lachnospiraceae bacterium]
MRNRLISTLAVLALAAALVFEGCGSNEKVIEPEPATEVTATPTPTVIPAAPTSEPEAEPTEEPAPEPTKIQGPFADPTTYAEITINFKNNCAVDIGMIAVLDPDTEEQYNLGGIETGKTLSVQMYWPSDKTELRWAVYTQGGELYSDSTTKVTGVTESVTITISGENTIEDIDVEIK